MLLLTCPMFPLYSHVIGSELRQGLCAAGVVDERTLTLLFLTVERYASIMECVHTICAKPSTHSLSTPVSADSWAQNQCGIHGSTCCNRILQSPSSTGNALFKNSCKLSEQHSTSFRTILFKNLLVKAHQMILYLSYDTKGLGNCLA